MDEEIPQTAPTGRRRRESEAVALLRESESHGDEPAFEVGVDVDTAHPDEDEDENDGILMDDEQASEGANHDHSKLYRILRTTLFKDEKISMCGYLFLDSAAAVKLLKFMIFTYASIFLLHALLPFYSHDRDRNLQAWQIWVYDGNLIASDAIVFFVVGRLWKKRGIDHLEWIGWILIANIYFESQQFFHFLQHSATLYEIHCKWPVALFVFVSFLIPTIIAIVFLHVQYAFKLRVLFLKATELLICLAFFVAPMATSPYFHMHHWLAGWLFGMHSNFDVWWSRAVMAWCWGAYINGIAVYGRDPVLTCEYAYFLTIDQHCPYVSCYIEGLERQANLTAEELANATDLVKEMVKPDWRNCSAHSYHP